LGESQGTKDRRFDCLCDCGKSKNVALSKLRSGNTKSCGCIRKEPQSKANFSHGGSHSKLYLCWCNMRRRCGNPKNKHYGGRGITICREWGKFEGFQKWAFDNGYLPGLSIERKDNNGNYEPGNCIWIPRNDQPRNSRRNVLLTLNGRTQYLQAWATELGVNRGTITSRLLRGKSIAVALSYPLRLRVRT
jgi:hypothetical protein